MPRCRLSEQYTTSRRTRKGDDVFLRTKPRYDVTAWRILARNAEAQPNRTPETAFAEW
jgi:hypothetical protein